MSAALRNFFPGEVCAWPVIRPSCSSKLSRGYLGSSSSAKIVSFGLALQTSLAAFPAPFPSRFKNLFSPSLLSLSFPLPISLSSVLLCHLDTCALCFLFSFSSHLLSLSVVTDAHIQDGFPRRQDRLRHARKFFALLHIH